MPPLEVWQKVLVKDKFLEKDVHADIGCIECHGGQPGTDDKDAAHEGMVKKVGANPAATCGQCHVDYAQAAQTNIHRLQTGYIDQLHKRGGDFTDPTFVRAYTNHCTGCHADCSDCHVSRPSALGGGLLSGHLFKKTASIWLTCGGCHSARIADDYKGNHEGIPPSIHWEKEGMLCGDCHTDDAAYHNGSHGGTRYEDPTAPTCIQCHEDVRPDDGIAQHDQRHLESMACQTCHAAGQYKSCYGCHTGLDEKGLPYFTTEPSQMTFKIGHNPIPSERHPWEWVLLRHAPANQDLFAFYGDNLLPGFDNLPTWKYTSPHNMRRITPQNKTCNSCHGQKALFLTEEDVVPEERAANAPVIVAPEEIPQPVEEEGGS
ncbi:MAG TPA: hypothetical protein ENK60_01750 [Anaerolineae bacterium]|nr:hypothetical protein [Anaerolineae bacterium]